jgi:hypothetical protein
VLRPFTAPGESPFIATTQSRQHRTTPTTTSQGKPPFNKQNNNKK